MTTLLVVSKTGMNQGGFSYRCFDYCPVLVIYDAHSKLSFAGPCTVRPIQSSDYNEGEDSKGHHEKQ